MTHKHTSRTQWGLKKTCKERQSKKSIDFNLSTDYWSFVYLMRMNSYDQSRDDHHHRHRKDSHCLKSSTLDRQMDCYYERVVLVIDLHSYTKAERGEDKS